jgi:DNA-binding GntR family transcriptional regulator/GNAT superfamily N-acetyltransferase
MAARPRSRGQQPLYAQIAAELRAEIEDRTLAPGQQLPTEMDLAERFQTTRTTVREAIRVLVAAGLVVTERPRGTFVREVRPMIYRPQDEVSRRPVTAEMDQFRTALAAEGRHSSQTIEVKILKPPTESVARNLAIPLDEDVAGRLRVRSIDGEPYNINDSFFPLHLVLGSDIMSADDIRDGANTSLAELGYEQAFAVDEFETRMPTPEESQRLALPPGTPVAVHTETGYTLSGLPVRCVINVLPGPKHKIVSTRELAPLGTPTSAVAITQGTVDDVDQVMQMLGETIDWLRRIGSDQWQAKPPTRQRAETAAETGTLFMVHTAAHTVGTVILDELADAEFWTPADHPEEALYVHRLLVRPGATGRGIGTSILDWASARAAAAGKSWLRLDAWRTNDRLHQLYQGSGWEHVRTVDLPHRGSGALFQLPAGTAVGGGPRVWDLTPYRERS